MLCDINSTLAEQCVYGALSSNLPGTLEVINHVVHRAVRMQFTLTGSPAVHCVLSVITPCVFPKIDTFHEKVKCITNCYYLLISLPKIIGS